LRSGAAAEVIAEAVVAAVAVETAEEARRFEPVAVAAEAADRFAAEEAARALSRAECLAAPRARSAGDPEAARHFARSTAAHP
jgi:hypothetical protein